MNLADKIVELFCNHDYQIIPEYDDAEERDNLVFELKKGESISFSRLHRCNKCRKEIMLGSGTNY